MIDPVFSSAWAPLITFLALLSAQNIGDVSAQKGVEFMFRSGTVGFFCSTVRKLFIRLFQEVYRHSVKKILLFLLYLCSEFYYLT